MVRNARAVGMAIAMLGAWLLVAVSAGPVRADTVTTVPGTTQLSAVACTSSQTCLVVGDHSPTQASQPESVVVPVTGGVPGKLWRPPGNFGASGVACTSASSCLMVGAEGVSGGPRQGAIMPVTNGVPGAATRIPGATDLTAVACVSANRCMAVGTDGTSPITASGVVVPITNGVPGTPRQVPGTSTFLGVACQSASSCVAVGAASGYRAAAVVSIANGVPGSPQSIGGGQLTVLWAVACPSDSSSCVAVGYEEQKGGVVVPINRGSAGALEAVPGTGYLYGVACKSSSSCLAVGEGSGFGPAGPVVPVTSNGTVGRPQAENGVGTLLGVDCPTVSNCLAVGINHQEGQLLAIGSANSSIGSALTQALTPSGPAASISAILKAGGYGQPVVMPIAGTLKVAWYYVPRGAHLASVAKPIAVAQASKTFAGPASATLNLRLTARGRTLLKMSKRLKLTAVGTFAPKNGKPASKRNSITLAMH